MKDEIKKRYIDMFKQRDNILSSFVQAFVEKHEITDDGLLEEIRTNIYNVFFFGMFSGKFDMENYIDSCGINPQKPIDVIYFQMNFLDPIDYKKEILNRRESNNVDLLESFQLELTEEDYHYYRKKGNFLRADSIVLLSQSRKQYLYVTDNSIFLNHILDVTNPDLLKRKLQGIRGELGKRVKFSNLSIDTSSLDGISLEESMIQYSNTVKDKTLVKVIQAGSYAYSFIQFLKAYEIDVSKNFYVSLMGQTDHDYSIINLKISSLIGNQSKELQLLQSCNRFYAKGKTKVEDDLKDDLSKVALKMIARNIKKSTNINLEQLKHLINGDKGSFILEDYIEGFQNTATKYDDGDTLRDDHATEIRRVIENEDSLILFLTGNPGIGKTTIITEMLKEMPSFLFLYTSCRRTVNDDVIEKFSVEDNLFSDKCIALSTSSVDEVWDEGKYIEVVNYETNNNAILKPSKKLTYLPKQRKINYQKGFHRFDDIGDGEIIEEDNRRTSGVLSRLCEGIKEQIQNEDITSIIGTFAIQALKRTYKDTTIQHFQKLFPFVKISKQTGLIHINDEAFNTFVEKVPVMWIMIDEITGTDEGVQLYHLIKELLIEQIYFSLNEEQRKKWNVKLIVADASITNELIINNHLNVKENYDYAKIYTCSVQEDIKALESTSHTVKSRKGDIPSWVINTNSYPANGLDIKYDLKIDAISSDEYLKSMKTMERRKKEDLLANEHDIYLVNEMLAYIQDRPSEQVILYVQNLKRIAILEQLFKIGFECIYGKEAEINEDYIVMSSQLTQEERKAALESTKKVKCVFMTSSASRGISFPNCTKIMAVLQTFQIEQELMEQIQLHYRMRGNSVIDATVRKHLHFYLVDSYVYEVDEYAYKRNKSVIHLLAFITLVRGALVSRINGYTQFGSHKLSIVPLGGKGIAPVHGSLIQDVADAMALIDKEIVKRSGNKLLNDLKTIMSDVFSSMEIKTGGQIFNNGQNEETIYRNYLEQWKVNLGHLLSFEPFQKYYLQNGMIIFQIDDAVEENIKFSLQKRHFSEELVSKIQQVKKMDISDDLRKKLHHIEEFIEYENSKHSNLQNVYLEKKKEDKRFVAFPLMAFTMIDQLKDYEPNPNDESYKDIIRLLLRYSTNLSSVTPIGSNYTSIPFVTFKSDTLVEQMNNRFKQNYLLTSTETNVLNLLLM